MLRKYWIYGLLAILLLLVFIYSNGYLSENKKVTPPVPAPSPQVTQPERKKPKPKAVMPVPEPASNDTREDDGFNRSIANIVYTKHARCRMGCRHIDDSEVKEILETGKINYEKSDLRGYPDPKYALEGITHDNQRVRIVFAPSPRGTVVITVIDLDTDWECECR
jgi:hypothetical protein